MSNAPDEEELPELYKEIDADIQWIRPAEGEAIVVNMEYVISWRVLEILITPNTSWMGSLVLHDNSKSGSWESKDVLDQFALTLGKEMFFTWTFYTAGPLFLRSSVKLDTDYYLELNMFSGIPEKIFELDPTTEWYFRAHSKSHLFRFRNATSTTKPLPELGSGPANTTGNGSNSNKSASGAVGEKPVKNSLDELQTSSAPSQSPSAITDYTSNTGSTRLGSAAIGGIIGGSIAGILVLGVILLSVYRYGKSHKRNHLERELKDKEIIHELAGNGSFSGTGIVPPVELDGIVRSEVDGKGLTEMEGDGPEKVFPGHLESVGELELPSFQFDEQYWPGVEKPSHQ
ncbi:hypothetical protein BJ508DRAFT_367528 [Ascobolus immersus RN42]|uniref:Uncharacterized protein n=1 Tax=Ascobolus immersus RN42 TaxID=1160509 RepID=A0A3N4HGG1_ASCIM|nr:hypothetical protein BJ508DRAFT_367528 [Ascobolus immersus RN42]